MFGLSQTMKQKRVLERSFVFTKCLREPFCGRCNGGLEVRRLEHLFQTNRIKTTIE